MTPPEESVVRTIKVAMTLVAMGLKMSLIENSNCVPAGFPLDPAMSFRVTVYVRLSNEQEVYTIVVRSLHNNAFLSTMDIFTFSLST